MRWQLLFEDLEAQAEQVLQDSFESEVADRTRRELARVRLADRFRAATGRHVTVRVVGLGVVHAAVQAAGPDWLLLGDPTASETLVPLAAVVSLTGLGPQASVPGSEGRVAGKLGLAFMMRGLARDRSEVKVSLVDGSSATGTVDRVGADFFELAERDPTEPRRSGAAHGVRIVPFSGLAALRRAV